ncbi:polyprenyl synthetase family protein [Candidatus Liberibacter americanus]|uniref:Geranylgeranyl pyrophosphate synthase n=1 Tax=Candidatus Liberibacter americanus str. Sao Paulo TaxID=1261131 RepID=U6B749_9HYPH|nr:polyprenyl synthetase family protein [Candidatus Liberibacter americanus]AHA27577.1 Geranylgeranyl pyrophosphate synthase [Candidatus Liberibacter americanus str. Sao Paulo]EMS36462.1 octaprenyl-diphosphate synthase protein [Candidatus Liberibacter americanus PW_SP]
MKMLEEITSNEMKQVNALIVDRLYSNVGIIPDIAKYLIFAGGKRLRPMLTLAASSMLKYDGNKHVVLASAIEFIHTATLLHDDVIDDGQLRRGKVAARLVWGNQASVLVGDFLLSQAFRMVIETESQQALEALSLVACTLSEGELQQLSMSKNLHVTKEDYLQVVKSKTAILFAAALEIASLISGADISIQKALRLYGMNLGVAFQLVDDVLDYSGNIDEMGKNIGDDFRNGKITLPVLIAFQRGTSQEKDFWISSVSEGKMEADTLEKALCLIKNSNALVETESLAHYYGKKAKDAIKCLPDSYWKESFLEVVDFCIGRINKKINNNKIDS